MIPIVWILKSEKYLFNFYFWKIVHIQIFETFNFFCFFESLTINKWWQNLNRHEILIFGKVMNFLISALFTLSLVLISTRLKFKIARNLYEEYILKTEKIINISQFWQLLEIRLFFSIPLIAHMTRMIDRCP